MNHPFFFTNLFDLFISTDLASNDNFNMLPLYFQGIESKVRTSSGMFLSSEEKTYQVVQVSFLSNLLLIFLILLWDALEASTYFLIPSPLLACHTCHFVAACAWMHAWISLYLVWNKKPLHVFLHNFIFNNIGLISYSIIKMKTEHIASYIAGILTSAC